MNVAVSNKNKDVIDKISFELIKRVDGEFEVSELLSNFVNLYFNKMIIDITSIKNYLNIEEIKKLASEVDPNRVILVLSDDFNDNNYLRELVKCGFYNFTRNFEGVNYLYSNPNSYDKVKYLVENKESTPVIIDTLDEETPVSFESKEIKYDTLDKEPLDKQKVIGLINLTNHAGASTLTNMLVNHLEMMGYGAIGIEMSRQDLLYYHNDALISCMNMLDLENALRKYNDASVVIIDLNEFSNANNICDEILYLVEPSQIRITKLLKKNRNSFIEHKKDKIVLNMSLLADEEVPSFEREASVKVFANIPPLNDRMENIPEINELLAKLGL